MDVAMQKVAWLKELHEGEKNFEARMRQVWLIVNAEWGGVCDEHVEITAVTLPVQ